MELPPPELHEKLLQEIGLGPKQRQAALAYRNHLLSRMGALLRQRRDISLQLLRTLGAPDKQAVRRKLLRMLLHQARRRSISQEFPRDDKQRCPCAGLLAALYALDTRVGPSGASLCRPQAGATTVCV